jgi:FkbM family methyltransferase
MLEAMRATRAKLEKSGRDLLYGSGVFFPLRSGYQFVFNRKKMAFRRKMRDFYATFIHRGDLVFDVGANVGMYSEIFTELGARVVAVEPNPLCCNKLALLARRRPVTIEKCAAGNAPGKTILHVCDDPGLSTVTEHWFEVARKSPLHSGAKWVRDLEVEVVTPDQLARKYGLPSFVKIDAEGFDDRVLLGMSFRPPALSFEYNRDIPQVALRCLETPTLAKGYEFNFARGLEMRLFGSSWMQAEEICGQLSSLVGNEEYGDVLARRIQ